MDKLKRVIEQYSRWSALAVYTHRIESSVDTDFSHALENVKALLETISKEICKEKNITIETSASFQAIIKKAFVGMGFNQSTHITQIANALQTICQQVGELRNEIGVTSHGRSLEELRARNQNMDELTKEFLIDSTIIVACFLIRTFEDKNPLVRPKVETQMILSEQEDFNNFWDDAYGDFQMGGYSFAASEILFKLDYRAYETEHKAFIENEENNT